MIRIIGCILIVLPAAVIAYYDRTLLIYIGAVYFTFFCLDRYLKWRKDNFLD